MQFAPHFISERVTILKVLNQTVYLRKMSFEQSLQIEIRKPLVDEEDLNVDVLSIFVQEVLQEVGDGLEGDVAAHDDMLLPVVRLVLAGVFRPLHGNSDRGTQLDTI